MKDQRFYIGKDSLESLERELTKIRPLRIFLIHGRRSYESCGAKSKMERILSRLSIDEVRECSDSGVNPEYQALENVLSCCSAFNPDLIMAVGGGSVIDMAKLTRFFLSYSGTVESNLYSQVRPLVPLIALPTTAGTGAEATHFAVLYKDKVKFSVEHEYILPDIAVVYPPFTYDNPPYLTACTGFDALAQGIEAYWSKNATEESDKYAEKAIGLIYPNLQLAVKSPAEEARDRMAEGAYWAGRAINITKTTAPHAFSYPFTSHYGYPHGHAVALAFPVIAEYNFKNGNIPPSKIDTIFRLLHINKTSVKKELSNFSKKLGLTLRPVDYNTEIILNGINPSRLSNNPTIIDIDKSKFLIDSIIASDDKAINV